MKKNLLVLALITLFFPRLFAQERFGMCSGMYAGISSEYINPSLLAATPFRWDLNLVTAQVYFNNNFLYLNSNLPNYYSSSNSGNGNIMVDNDYNRSKGIIDPFKLEASTGNSFKKTVNLNLFVMGPSLMINVKKWTFALSTDFRFAMSEVGFNSDAARLLYEGLTYTPLQNKTIDATNIRINGMAWYEIGLTAARVIKKVGDNLIKGGITIRHLSAYTGFFVNAKDMKVYVPNGTDLDIQNLNLNYGYAPDQSQYMNSKDSVTSSGGFTQIRGGGLSTDLGITIERKKLAKDYQCPNFCNKKLELQYQWKLGLSLIDIGYVHFNNHAETYQLPNNSAYYWADFNKLQIHHGVAGVDTTLSSNFLNSPNPNIHSTDFTMLTPWAASIQFDYNIGYNFYANATLVQRIPHFGLPGVDRADVLAITPRYEIRRIGVALPIVMYDYYMPSIGFAVRVDNFLTVGTDKIGSLIGNRTTGADFYFSIKINMLKKCPKENKSSITL